MEETIGYEALFSAEEWDAIQSGDWSDVPDEEFPAIQNKKQRREAAHVAACLEDRMRPRDHLWFLWRRVVCAVGRVGRRDLDPPWLVPGAPELSEDKARHKTRIFDPPGQYEGDEDRFDVECDLCGWLTAADTIEEAQAIVWLHEAFVRVIA